MKVEDIAWKLENGDHSRKKRKKQDKIPKNSRKPKKIKVPRISTKKVIIGLIVFVVFGGVYMGYRALNASSETRPQATQEDYQKLIDAVSQDLDKARRTRDSTDIETAQKSILKLKRGDRTAYQEELDQLKNDLTQLNTTEKAVEKAEASKEAEDISAAQTLVDNLMGSYLSNDKQALQERLNHLSGAVDNEEPSNGETGRTTGSSSAQRGNMNNSGAAGNTNNSGGNVSNSSNNNNSNTGNSPAPSTPPAPSEPEPPAPSEPTPPPSDQEPPPGSGNSLSPILPLVPVN